MCALRTWKTITTAGLKMPLLKVTGQQSVLTLHLEHPLHLNDGDDYKLALVGFYSENNIQNLRQEATIYFSSNGVHALTFTSGYWTLKSIQERAREYLKQNLPSVDETQFILEKVNGRVSIQSPIKFYLDESVSKLLGFVPISQDMATAYREAGTVIAENPPNIRTVDVIEVHCDIVDNSYVNSDVHKHAETSILYHFFPSVPQGFKISEKPQYPHYVPMKKGLRRIQQIRLMLTDQDNRILQNEDVSNIVYLDLRV
jgi:hypothetical protein